MKIHPKLYNAEHNKAFRDLLACASESTLKGCMQRYWIEQSKIFDLNCTNYNEVFNKDYYAGM